jgi:hypothetical protein
MIPKDLQIFAPISRTTPLRNFRSSKLRPQEIFAADAAQEDISRSRLFSSSPNQAQMRQSLKPFPLQFRPPRQFGMSHWRLSQRWR